jgi:hypothetical protein
MWNMSPTMKAVIDRIEGKFAILLMGDGSVKVNLPLVLLPDAKEGDILDVSITKDGKATMKAKDRSKSLIEKLKQKEQSGIIKD